MSWPHLRRIGCHLHLERKLEILAAELNRRVSLAHIGSGGSAPPFPRFSWVRSAASSVSDPPPDHVISDSPLDSPHML